MLDDFREWLSDNLRYILLGAAVLLFLIMVICVVRLVSGGSSEKKPVQQEQQQDVQQGVEDMSEAEEAQNAQNAEAPQAQQSNIVTAGSDLTKDDPAILELMQKFYTAVAAKDITTLSGIVSPWNEDIQKKILSNDVVESYSNISTYSEAGAAEGEYVVFVYFEGKIADINTLVPSLARQYVVTNAAGDLVTCSDLDDSMNDCVNTVSATTSVQALVADIQKLYDNAIASDSDLAAYMDGVENTGSDEQEAAPINQEMTVVANTGLNIRQQPSSEANILGSVGNGQTVTVLEEAGDGWVHINYNSMNGMIDGYVMLQYLA